MKRLTTLLLTLLLLLPAMSARAEEAQDITRKVKISCDSGELNLLTDDYIRTYWYAGSRDRTITIDIDPALNPGSMMLKWFGEPTDYEILIYDASGVLLNRYTLAGEFVCIAKYYPLDASTAKVLINVPAESSIASLRFYSQGEVSDRTQIWQPPVEKADLMVISTHQDDELLWFGGTIPYYDVVRDMDVVVTYMTSCGRSRRQEALNGLWAMGVRTYPEFLNLKDFYAGSFSGALEVWGGEDAVYELLARTIRRYKPEVIVTHDLKGEYGHPQHIATARVMKGAIEAAADPNRYPDSAQEYGAWQVKKVYLHLYEENTLYMDWDTPAEELGGLTPLQVASIGYDEHESQHGSYNMEFHGKKYDNSKFGLAYSTVGEDIEKNDFFENIPGAAPTPEATLAPTQEPAPEATAAPTQEPAPEATLAPAPSAARERHDSVITTLTILGGALLAFAIGIAMLQSAARKRRRKRKRRSRSKRWR